MKVLIALPFFPYPQKEGGQQATFHLINYLRKHAEITLACPYATEENLFELKEKWADVNIVIPPVHAASIENVRTKLKRRARQLLTRVSGLARTVITGKRNHASSDPIHRCDMIRRSRMRLYRNTFMPHHREFVIKVQELMESTQFDIVQIEFAPLMSLVHFIPERCIKIFVHHEISFILLERELITLQPHSAYDSLLLHQARMIELSLLRKYDRVLVLSGQDKGYLQAAGIDGRKVLVSPFNIPQHITSNNTDTGFRFKNKIVFLGSESHNPNLDAIYWFVKDIWPLIIKDNPDVVLSIIGSWKKEVVALLSGFPNIVFTGYVDDLGEALDGAIMVVPIRIGSGVRTKIIDAVMRRVPVVTTSIGLEGILLEDGKECLIADTPEGFVQSLKLLSRNEYATRLINNAYAKISERADSEECGRVRKEIYESVLSEQYVHMSNA